MGIDFDESGRNDEYGADANESTGEIGDTGKSRQPAAPVQVLGAPAMHGNVNDLVASIMGNTSASPAEPQTAAAALETSQDAYMDQVEERLDVAAHYRILLANPMFDNNTRASQIVTHEMRGFIRERLGVLLGIGDTSKKPELFSDVQLEVLRSLGELTLGHVTALKLVASKLLGEAPPPREAPVLRPAPAPQAPAQRPAPAPVGPRRAPPAPAPASTQPAAAPIEEQRPRGPGRPPGSKNKPKDEPEMVQAIRKHPDGSEEPLFHKDGSPRMVKVIPKRPQQAAGRLPFPNESQMAQVTAVQATQRAQLLESNPNVQRAFEGLKNPT
jgi:hypothetical protein